MVPVYHSRREQIKASQGKKHIGQSPRKVPHMELPYSFPHGVIDNIDFLASVYYDTHGVLPAREAHLSLVQSVCRSSFMYYPHDWPLICNLCIDEQILHGSNPHDKSRCHTVGWLGLTCRQRPPIRPRYHFLVANGKSQPSFLGKVNSFRE